MLNEEKQMRRVMGVIENMYCVMLPSEMNGFAGRYFCLGEMPRWISE